MIGGFGDDPAADTAPGPDDEFALMVLERTAEAFGFWYRDGLHWHPQDAPRRYTRKCSLCTPGCWTRPLCIDGNEYRRRLRNRRKAARRRRGRAMP